MLQFSTGWNEMEYKRRWKGLRDSYKQCKRMEQVASGSSAESSRKKWKYMEAMSFLDNVTNFRRTIGNLDDLEYIVETEVLQLIEDYANLSMSASESSQNITSDSRRRKKNDNDKFQKHIGNLYGVCGSNVKPGLVRGEDNRIRSSAK